MIILADIGDNNRQVTYQSTLLPEPATKIGMREGQSSDVKKKTHVCREPTEEKESTSIPCKFRLEKTRSLSLHVVHCGQCCDLLRNPVETAIFGFSHATDPLWMIEPQQCPDGNKIGRRTLNVIYVACCLLHCHRRLACRPLYNFLGLVRCLLQNSGC